MEPEALFKLLTDAGPWAVALVLAYALRRSEQRGDRLEAKLLDQLPALTTAMNRMRWLIQGRKGPEDDEERGR